MDLGHSFDKLMAHVFIKYEGCLIEKTGSGFIALKKPYKTLEEAKTAIDNAFIQFNNTLKNQS